MEHTKLLDRLVTRCQEMGVTLYEHSYNYQAFGSWYIIVGKPHHRMRFSWDGKESYLVIGESEFTNANSVPEWKPIQTSISGTKTKPAEVFHFIQDKLEERYGT